jgi:hypothetical protein
MLVRTGCDSNCRKKLNSTHSALQVTVGPMKLWSWYFIIGAVFVALTLSSCMNQEGIAPGSGEMPGRPTVGQ